MQSNKIVIPGKVDRLHGKKFKVRKDRGAEIDADIEIVDDGDYEVQKLSMDGMPTHMDDGTPIRWFANFAIRKGGEYINQRYFVTIEGLHLSKVVILDRKGNLYYYAGKVANDTIELTDGDPGVGGSP